MALLAVGVLVVAFGIAGYLEACLGAGPFEAAVLALRPLPFRVAFTGLQTTGALVGWVLGADVGIGTLAMVVVVGPLVDVLRRAARRRG